MTTSTATKNPAAQALGASGGHARASKLSPERRIEIARVGGKARASRATIREAVIDCNRILGRSMTEEEIEQEIDARINRMTKTPEQKEARKPRNKYKTFNP